MIDSQAVGWGVEIDRVEIKDVELPDSMKRSMSRQAEAERERRSRIITAVGPGEASAVEQRSCHQTNRLPGSAGDPRHALVGLLRLSRCSRMAA
jgi:regulator of protease activity HflC (stomatin/prohibitin superfamily)